MFSSQIHAKVAHPHHVPPTYLYVICAALCLNCLYHLLTTCMLVSHQNPYVYIQHHKHTIHCVVDSMTLHPSTVSCTACVVSVYTKSLSLLSYNIMTMCWQQNPEDRPPFLQIVEKLRTFNERLKTESICLDCDSIEDPGEFERGDSGRSWIRGSLRDSIRRIRTSIHRQNSVRGVRRQSSFKGELTTNGQVSIHPYCSSVVEKI